MSETALAFLLAYTIGLIAALFVRPIFGLYTYVGVFYIHPPSRWWGDVIPDIRWSLVAAVVTLFAMYIHKGKSEQRPSWMSSRINVYLLIYVIWMWIQWPWVISASHQDGVILFTKYAVLLYLIFSLLDNEKDFADFSLAHVLGCGFLGWLVYLAPDSGRLEGVGGPGIDDANTLGMHLATGVIFAGFMFLASKGWRRWIVFLAIPFILNGVIQTETRGALVGLFLGALATVYLKPKEIRRTYYTLAALAIVAFIAVANQAFLERMASLNAAVDETAVWDTSAQSRIAIVSAQLEMFVDHPLGVGHQGTATLSRQYLDQRWLASNSGDRASHNTLMSIVVDQGLPGAILATLLAVVVTRSLRQMKKWDESGLELNFGLYRAMIGGALVTIIGAGMFAQYLKAEVQYWCLALLAALWALSRHSMSEIVVSEESEQRVGRRLVPGRAK